MPRHKNFQSKHFSDRRKERTALAVGLILVSLSTWLYSFSKLSHVPFLSIQHVQIVGADPEIIGSLQAAAEDSLQGDFFHMFSRANALTYSENAVKANVRAASPRVESVSIEKAGLNGLAVTVHEKTPAALVCPNLPDLTDPKDQSLDGCYFADESGFIFEPASAISITGNAYDMIYAPGISDASSTVIGSFATSTPKFRELRSFMKGARDAGLATDGLLIKDGGEYELYTENPSSSESNDVVVVYFNDSRKLSDELANLLAFWKSMPASFDYIDVRYGSNVFYKKIH